MSFVVILLYITGYLMIGTFLETLVFTDYYEIVDDGDEMVAIVIWPLFLAFMILVIPLKITRKFAKWVDSKLVKFKEKIKKRKKRND